MDKHVFEFPGLTSGSISSNLSNKFFTLGILSTLGILHDSNSPVVKVLGLRPSTLTTGLLVLL